MVTLGAGGGSRGFLSCVPSLFVLVGVSLGLKRNESEERDRTLYLNFSGDH